MFGPATIATVETIAIVAIVAIVEEGPCNRDLFGAATIAPVETIAIVEEVPFNRELFGAAGNHLNCNTPAVIVASMWKHILPIFRCATISYFQVSE